MYYMTMDRSMAEDTYSAQNTVVYALQTLLISNGFADIFLLRSKSIQIEPANITIAGVYIVDVLCIFDGLKMCACYAFLCITWYAVMSITTIFFLLLLFRPKHFSKWFSLVKLAISIVPPHLDREKKATAKAATAAAAAAKKIVQLVSGKHSRKWTEEGS